MPDLKSQIFYYLKKYHRGKENAITVRNLANEFRALRCSDREIREALRELNLEGKAVITSTRSPFGVFMASSQEEVQEYLNNLGSRVHAILKRMRAVDQMMAKEFIKRQLELF